MPKFRFPQAVCYPIHIFTIFVRVKYDYKTVGKWFFGWLSAIHSFVEDKYSVSTVGSVFLVGFDDEVWHGSLVLKNPTIFFQKEKGKKESPENSRNDERERREVRPTGSEEWMLNLLPFFSFLFEKMQYVLVNGVFKVRELNTPKHRRKQKKWCPFFGARNFFLRTRSAVAVLRQSSSHARPGMKRNDSGVECRDSSV
nr:hypothetical protein [Flavobacterium palustre]